jgi:hypothetical protein
MQISYNITKSHFSYFVGDALIELVFINYYIRVGLHSVNKGSSLAAFADYGCCVCC